MKKHLRLRPEEQHKVLMQFYEDTDREVRAFKNDTRELTVIKRERLYFILAIVFGFLFSLSASVVDNLVQVYSANKEPNQNYLTYACIVIALSLTATVWLLSKIRDLGQYILLAERKQIDKNKKQ